MSTIPISALKHTLPTPQSRPQEPPLLLSSGWGKGIPVAVQKDCGLWERDCQLRGTPRYGQCPYACAQPYHPCILEVTHSLFQTMCPHPSSGGPAAVRRAGRKGATKFSSTGGRVPGYPHGQANASSWLGTKNVNVPHRRTASPEFLSWVRTRQLFTRSRIVWKCTQSGNLTSYFKVLSTQKLKHGNVFKLQQVFTFAWILGSLLIPRWQTASKTCLEKCIFVFPVSIVTVSIVFIPTRLLYQMQTDSSGAEFLSTISKSRKRKKILSLLVCVLHKTGN